MPFLRGSRDQDVVHHVEGKGPDPVILEFRLAHFPVFQPVAPLFDPLFPGIEVVDPFTSLDPDRVVRGVNRNGALRRKRDRPAEQVPGIDQEAGISSVTMRAQ